MFLRQNILYFAVYASGGLGSDVLSGGRCCPADGLRVFKRLKWLFFKVGSISAKKARIQKNVML